MNMIEYASCDMSDPWLAMSNSFALSTIWMFPKIMGTPKSSILIRFSIINHPFWGYPYFWKHPSIGIQWKPPRFSSSPLKNDSWKDDPLLSFLGFRDHFFRGEFAVKLPAGKFDQDFRRQKGGEKYQNLSQKPKIQVVYEDILDLLMVPGRNKNRFSKW